MKTTEPSKQEANFKAESTVTWPKVLDALAVAQECFLSIQRSRVSPTRFLSAS